MTEADDCRGRLQPARDSAICAGSATKFRITIDRKFTHRGRTTSYITAGCPTGTYYTEGEIIFSDGSILQGVHPLPCTPVGAARIWR